MENIGERIKHLRKSHKMTLKMISEKTDLSISFLSQLEHGKCSITLESLKKISEALNVLPSYFFSPEENQPNNRNITVRKKTMDETEHISDFIYKDLSGNFPNQAFFATLVTLQPRKHGVKPLAHSHRGQEFIYVLEGTLTIILSDDEVQLNAGESVHMESTTPHNWLNQTEDAVKFLYVSSN